jgi:hypothetical protein
MSGSPFSGVARQEKSFYLGFSLFPSLRSGNVVPLPPPINGMRITEAPTGYDNFMEDTSTPALKLEEAAYLDNISFTNAEGDADSKSITVSFDSTAAARAEALDLSKQIRELDEFIANPEASDSSKETAQQQLNDAKNQKEYFTWQTAPSMFTNAPTARPFSEPPRGSIDTPLWSYVAVHRSGLPQIKQTILAPWQQRNPPDQKTPIHWGVQKKTDHAPNQPFEATMFYCFREPAVPDFAPMLNPRFRFVQSDRTTKSEEQENDLKIDLTKTIYFAIEMGKGNADNHYLLLFRYKNAPAFFRILPQEGGAIPKAVLVSEFNNEEAVNKVLSPNDRELSVKIESAGGNLLIRSSAFGNTPWIIHMQQLEERDEKNNLTPRKTGMFIGKKLSLYGGNIQAGFSYAPIQYEREGLIKLPIQGFQVPFTSSGGGQTTVDPTVSISLKGTASAEQEKSKNGDLRIMADAEAFFGDAELPDESEGSTVIEAVGGDNPEYKAEMNRLITIEQATIETDLKTKDGEFNFNQSTEGVAGVQGIISLTRGGAKSSSYQVGIILEASNVQTDSGFVIPNGRSPYIWMVRQSMPVQEGGTPTRVAEITSDIMSLELAWNTTGIGEVTATGSMQVLTKPRRVVPGGVSVDYEEMLNKITYIEIDVERLYGTIDDESKQMFTGCIVSAEVSDEPGRRVINFKLEDYMWVMQAVKTILSPPYDGMYFHLAVADLVSRTGLPRRNIFVETTQVDQVNKSQQPYLPIIDLFNQPKWRFPDGTSIKDAVLKIAKLDWRIIYFDPQGNFVYDSLPQGMFGDESPTGDHIEFFTGETDGWDPTKLVWNNVSKGFSIKDMYNSVQVVAVDKRIPGLLLEFSDTNTQSIWDTDSPGYIGFVKTFRQRDGALEGPQAFAYFAKMVQLMYNVPKTIKFETYGRTDLRPAQVIKVDGRQYRIMNLSLKFDASKHEFWASIEGEWFDITNKSQSGDANRPAAIDNSSNASGGTT